MSIGRQGFVGNVKGLAARVPVPWVGRWVEAYFADNSSQFARTVTDPYVGLSVSPYRYGTVQNRPTPLSAVTSESWLSPHHDGAGKTATYAEDPTVLWELFGHYLYRLLPTQVHVPYDVASWNAYGAARVDAGDSYTFTQAEATAMRLPAGATQAVVMLALHRGSVTNTTTGVTFQAIAPTVPLGALTLPTHQIPKEYVALPISIGETIQFSAGTILSTGFEVHHNTQAVMPPVFNMRLPVDYVARSPTVGIDYKAIHDIGSPTSLHGVPWIDAIYPDVPAYKLEFDFLPFYQEFTFSFTYQGGAGITSYASMYNHAVTNELTVLGEYSHNITTFPQALTKAWHNYSIEIYPVDPTTNTFGYNWEYIVKIDGNILLKYPTNQPDISISNTPNITLGAIYFNPFEPMKIKNVRMSYWERL